MSAICGSPGDYESRITIWMPAHWTTAKERQFDVDACIASLILELIHKNGIRTIECCCGHGTQDGYVAVDSDSEKTMAALGFKSEKYRSDTFVIALDAIEHIGPSR